MVYKVADISLAAFGRKEIEIAEVHSCDDLRAGLALTFSRVERDAWFDVLPQEGNYRPSLEIQ
jgi:hypothetical protein